MHICWFITTAVQTHWCGPTIRCQCHLYPVYGRPTTIEQADFHVFCQPHDILIRLFKIHIQKMDHNSRWLISVDLPFLYFLGREINTCGMKNAYYTLSTVFIFCFERCWSATDANVHSNAWNTVYSNGVKVLMLLKYAWGGWCLLGNTPALLAQVQSVNKHKIAFFIFRYNFFKTSLYSFMVVVDTGWMPVSYI